MKEQITVFSIVYNNYGRFIPQWNEYINKQTIPVKKFVVLGHDHGADMQYLKDNNIDHIYYDSVRMGVLRNKGVETFFYQLAKQFEDRDITIVCKTGDNKQIERLKKYVRVVKYNGNKIKLKRVR